MKKLLFYAELAIHHPAKSEKAQTIRIPASTLGGLQGVILFVLIILKI